MPNRDLTRARRKLGILKRRLALVASSETHGSWRYSPRMRSEACRMARELAREIKAQELECRRLALRGPWRVDERTKRMAYCGLRAHGYTGRNAKARAVKWAERMNRKENGK